MPTTATLAVVATLTFATSARPVGEEKPPDNQNMQGIQAAVRGILQFEAGRGYFIFVKSTDKSEPDMRVWLRISEDKALVRQLQGLSRQDVVAEGKLAQMPEEVQSAVPPMGMYLTRFEIRSAGAR